MRPTEILDIIIIIYYVPALLIAIYVALKHGFARSAGWFNLNMLSLFRIVGSILSLVGIYHPSTGVIATSYIFSSIGTVSLLGALLGLVGRANESLGDKAIPPRTTRLVNLVTVVAAILAIIGGKDAFSSDPSTASTGHTLSKAAIVLLIVIYVIAVAICMLTLAMHTRVPQKDRRLLHVSLISLPFILVRLILAICSVFDYSSSTFSMVSTTNTAVIVRALMGYLPEFVVVALFLWAGCTVDRSAQREMERQEKHAAHGQYRSNKGYVYDPTIAA